jgi:hypothetical protein
MASNLDKIKLDLDRLIDDSADLLNSASHYVDATAFRKAAVEALGDKADDFIKGIPRFTSIYETWYSEAVSVVAQLLPTRLADFRDQYEVPRSRKQLDPGSYRIIDMLQGLRRIDGGADTRSGLPRVQTQVAILKAAASRFSSSLFEIKQIVQADFIDSEIETSFELLNNGYIRAAGAVAGVALERHLKAGIYQSPVTDTWQKSNYCYIKRCSKGSSNH